MGVAETWLLGSPHLQGLQTEGQKQCKGPCSDALYRGFGGTGSYWEMEALFEFSGSQLLTAFWRKEKICIPRPHFKKAV